VSFLQFKRPAFRWVVGFAIALTAILLFLIIPFFPGSGFLGVGSNVTLHAGEHVRLWIPPYALPDHLLRLSISDADSLVYRAGARRIVWKSDEHPVASLSCSLLKGWGVLTLQARDPHAMASVRIVGARSASQVLLYMLAGLFAWVIFKRLFFNESKIRTIFQFALAVRFLYGLCIPWSTYSADISGHYSYIHLLSQNWQIPSAGACLECYQPPSYYFLAAIGLRVAEFVGVDASDLLRILSLFFSAGFLYFGIRAIQMLLLCPLLPLEFPCWES